MGLCAWEKRHRAEKLSRAPTKFAKMSFCRFNQVTGRIASSVQRAAYNPAGFQGKVVESAPAEFTSKTITAAPVEEPVMATGGAPATFENSRGMFPQNADYKRMVLDVQEEWAKNPHLLVWQKRGAIDSTPLYLTYALCGLGMAYTLKVIYEMSFPKKQE